MSLPFAFHSAHNAFDGTENDLKSDSDFEHLNNEQHERVGDGVHIWYGRLLLAQQVAQNIAKDAPPEMAIGDLDVSSHETIPHRASAEFSKVGVNQSHGDLPVFQHPREIEPQYGGLCLLTTLWGFSLH